MSAVDREMAETFVYETEEMLRSLDETVARNEGADSLSAPLPFAHKNSPLRQLALFNRCRLRYNKP